MGSFCPSGREAWRRSCSATQRWSLWTTVGRRWRSTTTSTGWCWLRPRAWSCTPTRGSRSETCCCFESLQAWFIKRCILNSHRNALPLILLCLNSVFYLLKYFSVVDFFRGCSHLTKTFSFGPYCLCLALENVAFPLATHNKWYLQSCEAAIIY